MIRPIIKDQLERCQFADLSNYDTKANTFAIKKYSKPTYEKGKCYLVKLHVSEINNPNSVLAVNWNSGNSPKTQFLKICISKTFGNMIYVDSLGFDFERKQDLNMMWSGWLNTTTLSQIS